MEARNAKTKHTKVRHSRLKNSPSVQVGSRDHVGSRGKCQKKKEETSFRPAYWTSALPKTEEKTKTSQTTYKRHLGRKKKLNRHSLIVGNSCTLIPPLHAISQPAVEDSFSCRGVGTPP
ncbi:unnamed protein product [Ectocarpus sp. 4 AP-2014]